MKVVIRTDASRAIGTGHVMRCLSLADALTVRGASVHFICRERDGNLGQRIRERGFSVSMLAATGSDQHAENDVVAWLGTRWQDDANETRAAIDALGFRADWLIVDQYALDRRWEERIRDCVGRVMVIDDLADRKHECDLLLDQNLYADAGSRYRNKLPEKCEVLLGPRFALLRSDFAKARVSVNERRGIVRRIFVFFGGTDPGNLTAISVTALTNLANPQVAVDVVIGEQQPGRAEIEAACRASNFACHVQTNQMATLMANADLAIGAGGSATWERCCVGLPSLMFSIAENQQELLSGAALAGLVYAPNVDPSDDEAIGRHVSACIENPHLLQAMSKRAMDFVDGRGCERVARAMGIFSLSIREATTSDCEAIFEWRNHPDIRKVSRNTEPLQLDTHRTWFEKVIADSNRYLLIGELAGEAVGVVRFDVTVGQAEVSIYRVPDKGQAGIGTELLLAAEHWLKRARPEVVELHAEVAGGNHRSHRLFANSGYTGVNAALKKRIQ